MPSSAGSGGSSQALQLAARMPNVSRGRAAGRAAPSPGLRLLVVEHSRLEYDILVATLEREGINLRSRRVQTAAQLGASLGAEPWDAVISEHHPAGFSSHEALDLVRAKLPHCPFIIISGAVGEDAAVVAMRHGADDYLVRGRLARLVPSLLNAIAAADSRRERAEAKESLQRSESQLRELLLHLETVVDEERKEIASEIHDDIGGALTALRLDMNWIGHHGDQASARRATHAMQTLAQVMDASLRLQHRLRPAVLDEGLVAALRWLSDDASRRSEMRVEFHCNSEQVTVDASIALATYRTLQESLTNITKHAGATRVQVGLVVSNGQLSLEITDNGCGIGSTDRIKPTSFGLRGMEERARSLGGWVEVSSLVQAKTNASSGTVVFLSLPLQGKSAGSMGGPASGESVEDTGANGPELTPTLPLSPA